MRTDRLLQLAEYLETLPPERFDYGRWVDEVGFDYATQSCGTNACALGWACMMPEFQAEGLRIGRDSWNNAQPQFGKSRTAIGAAEKFFELKRSEAHYLFLPDYGKNWLPEEASPQCVASHIRQFVANGVPKTRVKRDRSGFVW